MKSSNKIKIEGGMSSMTDLVFLLLIFFIILATKVDVNHNIKLPTASGDVSESSPVKVYIDSLNKFFINNKSESYNIHNISNEITNVIGENKTIELLADKETNRASAYEIIRIAKQKALKVVIKTRGSK